MRTQQSLWTSKAGWTERSPGLSPAEATLGFVFGSSAVLAEPERFADVQKRYPKAHVIGCSTAGEICDTDVHDETLVVTAVDFDSTEHRLVRTNVADASESFSAGERLARELAGDGLKHVIVISDGLRVNGTKLTEGIKRSLPSGVAVTGGLSADGDRFAKTLVCANAAPAEGLIAAIGFYGDGLRVGYGSLGGWDPFGPERIVTRSEGNVLYELDGRSALELYKEYLGDHAKGLPATGLLFPLSVRASDSEVRVVRTVLSVDEDAGSMTFAGDLPQGHIAQLMKANFDRLIDGAHGAAEISRGSGDDAPALALLISCVGRRLVLKQRVEEELESVRDVVGEQAVLTGFYSYGEICPAAPNASCELHNQTMTITTLSEVT